MYSFNTAAQYWCSPCTLAHTHTHTASQWATDTTLFVKAAIVHAQGVLYSSVLFFETSLWLPENDGVSIMFPNSTLHTRSLLSSDNYSKNSYCVRLGCICLVSCEILLQIQTTLLAAYTAAPGKKKVLNHDIRVCRPRVCVTEQERAERPLLSNLDPVYGIP